MHFLRVEAQDPSDPEGGRAATSDASCSPAVDGRYGDAEEIGQLGRGPQPPCRFRTIAHIVSRSEAPCSILLRLAPVEVLCQNGTVTPDDVVATNVLQLRQARGWSRRELAERVNRYLGSDAWSRYVVLDVEGQRSGRQRTVSPTELAALARAFGISALGLMIPQEGEVVEFAGDRWSRDDFALTVFHLPSDVLPPDFVERMKTGIAETTLGRLMEEIAGLTFKTAGGEWMPNPRMQALAFEGFPKLREWTASLNDEARAELRRWLMERIEREKGER